MARRLLEYTAMHHCRYEKPVYPVVINLTGSSRQDDRYIFECLELTVVDFNYRQINLQDIAGRELLYRGPVGLLPLAPLMSHDEPPDTVLDKCAKRLQGEVEAEDERSILYVALAALSSLRFSKDLILKALGVSKLENLPLFDGIREEWEARGRDEGIVEAIMEALEENIGQKPKWLMDSLSSVKDRDLLKKILRLAVKARNLEEFQASIKGMLPN